jgi:hypothetical protein
MKFIRQNSAGRPVRGGAIDRGAFLQCTGAALLRDPWVPDAPGESAAVPMLRGSAQSQQRIALYRRDDPEVSNTRLFPIMTGDN